MIQFEKSIDRLAAACATTNVDGQLRTSRRLRRSVRETSGHAGPDLGLWVAATGRPEARTTGSTPACRPTSCAPQMRAAPILSAPPATVVLCRRVRARRDQVTRRVALADRLRAPAVLSACPSVRWPGRSVRACRRNIGAPRNSGTIQVRALHPVGGRHGRLASVLNLSRGIVALVLAARLIPRVPGSGAGTGTSTGSAPGPGRGRDRGVADAAQGAIYLVGFSAA